MDVMPLENGLPNVVKMIHWERSANVMINGETVNVCSYGKLKCETPTGENYTLYEDITYEQVCGWLNSGLNVYGIDIELQMEIYNLMNGYIVNLPLPFTNPTI
jgi:hypothetical protein